MTTTKRAHLVLQFSFIFQVTYVIFFLMKTFSFVFFFELVICQELSNIAEPRIVGGYACDVKENAPFTVAIFNRVMCGGVLVNYFWILTAAHCIHQNNTNGFITTARVGFNSPSDLIQERKVERTNSHVNYDKTLQDKETEMRFDIGMVRVDKKFDPSPVAQLAKLPEVGDTSNCLNALAVGIGLTRPDENVDTKDRNELYNRPLMCVELPLILNVETCQNAYKNAKIDDTVFCASGSGKDTCVGDSGGPLICDGKVIGIISYGPKDCGGPSGTAIYTKVESYLNFIKDLAKRTPMKAREEQVENANRINHICRWKLIFIFGLVLIVY